MGGVSARSSGLEKAKNSPGLALYLRSPEVVRLAGYEIEIVKDGAEMPESQARELSESPEA